MSKLFPINGVTPMKLGCREQCVWWKSVVLKRIPQWCTLGILFFTWWDLRDVTASMVFLLVLTSSKPIWLATGTGSLVLNTDALLAPPVVATGATWRHSFVTKNQKTIL